MTITFSSFFYLEVQCANAFCNANQWICACVCMCEWCVWRVKLKLTCRSWNNFGSATAHCVKRVYVHTNMFIVIDAQWWETRSDFVERVINVFFVLQCVNDVSSIGSTFVTCVHISEIANDEHRAGKQRRIYYFVITQCN